MQMTKKTGIAILIISLLAIVLSAVSLIVVTTGKKEPVQEQKAERDIQYVMYVGTNDKDSNEPVCSPEEARNRVADILIRHFGGYTIQTAEGGWLDGDKLYQEYTLVIYLSDTNLNQVHAAADELISAFHQSSILIQSNRTETEFYAGVGA